MIESAQAVGYGRVATEALRQVIETAQDHDPLAPVTVVVPSNTVGLGARRVLGSGRGLVNVSCVTPFGLAQRLGTSRAVMAGQRSLTNPMLVAAIRVELRAGAGFFDPVKSHPSTEAALAQRYAELSRARPETIDRLRRAGTTRTKALIEIFERVRTRLTGFADEDALARHALAAVGEIDAPVAVLGTVVVYLPQPIAPALTELVAAVAHTRPSHVIAGLTGDPDADAPVIAHCRRIGAEIGADLATRHEIVTGTQIVTGSDVDEEVRAVLRSVLDIAASGIAFDRMAILMPAVEPYARTVHAQLEASGIPYNGRSVRCLGDTSAGRTLAGFVRLVDSTFARADVVAFLAAGPLVTNDGRSIPVDHWDRISRRAGVVGGEDWNARLVEYSVEIADRAEAREHSGGGGTAGLRRDAAAARALAAYVAQLAGRLMELDGTPGWGERATLAAAVLGELLGDSMTRLGWCAADREAYDAVVVALERLADLDRIEPVAPFSAFARAINAELEAPTGRIGRFGRGVVCASLDTGLGLDMDAVFVLGLAEGLCPSPRREDALLTDADRALAVDGELPIRAVALDEQRRHYLSALAAGAEHRVLSYPRGDLRSGRDRLPSRWLLETASALASTRVFASDFAALDDAMNVHAVPSFAAGIAHPARAVSVVEYDLGVLSEFVAEGGDPDEHPLVAGSALERGVEAIRGRASASFTRWDGNVAAVRDRVATPGSGEVVSATRLETWASCPFQYLLEHVMRIPVEDDPERLLELTPRVRGTLVHEILERFIGEDLQRAPGDRVAAGAPWPESAGVRMMELLVDAGSAAERRGLTGKAALWAFHREEIGTDLLLFLESDSEHRVASGAIPEAVELTFGLDGAPAVTVDLPSGRAVRFRGRADRVDRRADGSALVLDYKTGRANAYPGLEADPVKAGLRLQLPVYAEAVRQARGADGSDVAAAYWHVSTRGGFHRDEVVLDSSTRERFGIVVDHIADGIDAGTFPAVPGEVDSYFGTFDNCRFCDFDRLCPTDRLTQWDQKIDAPEFGAFHSLVPDRDEDPDAEGQ